MKLLHFKFLSSLASTLLLVACGGGGGGDGGGGGGGGGSGGAPAPSIREALPQVIQDINPSGTRIDLRSSNYFPANSGDTWSYDKIENGVTTTAALRRTVQSASGNDFVVAETSTSSSIGSGVTSYRRTPNGILALNPLQGDAPLAVSTLVGDMLEYPEPFYAVGETRKVIRQGNWGADIDGDGIFESFRLEYSQVLVGFEPMTLPRGSAETAHFRQSLALTISPSSLNQRVVTVTSNEDSWWAPGIGMVRAQRATTDTSGTTATPPYTLTLTSGTVNGTTLFLPPIDGTVLKIPLVHNALIYAPLNRRYYASVPSSVMTKGNSIASIDPVSGAVSYSEAVGSEPSALGLAADGSALYVGLNGSGEVIKLSLPDMRIVSRTRLPAPPFYGQMIAENISVSPINSNVVAVSLARTTVSPRHGGVALIRNGELQPRITQDHTGSNLIAFDGNGQFVYGFNNETTEFGLRRIEVLADGLAEQQVVSGGGTFGSRSLDYSAGQLVQDSSFYRTPDMALLGRTSAANRCRPHSVANRLVCLDTVNSSNAEGRVTLLDASSFVKLASPAFTFAASSKMPDELVAGPAGQVALRFSSGYFPASSSGEIWLFTSSALQ